MIPRDINYEIDPETTVRSFKLTQLQEDQARLISPVQQAYFETMVAALTTKLADTRMSGTSEEIQRMMQEFAYTQGRRDILLTLLGDASDAYAELAADSQAT